MTSIVWFRHDLRLADNPALSAAGPRGLAVLPVFIYSPEEEAPWPPGSASRWWLHQSLKALDASLRVLGSKLIICRGPTVDALLSVATATGARSVFWNRRYEPVMIRRDALVMNALRESGLLAQSFNGSLLHEPWTIENQSGKPFQVFTPFWRKCLDKPDPAEPIAQPKKLVGPDKWPRSLPIEELELEEKIDWASGLRATWTPGEAGATAQVNRFLAESFTDYRELRNRPDITGTSRLSPHLHFGEISPRQIWHAVAQAASRTRPRCVNWRSSQFLTELGWREFAHHLLYFFPETPSEPLRPNFLRFPWRKDAIDWLKAWQRGQTGYPIVDAGMRELWATGWMHNRVRMIVASFLVKDLLISWTEGAPWFWDTLVDADLAQNTLGWQWTAGCGADAAPYFRIFNPVSQGEKFDPHGVYVRKWCPEISKLPDKWIHQPWNAPRVLLQEASLELGRQYPLPIVSHAIAREVALEAFQKLRAPSSLRTSQ